MGDLPPSSPFGLQRTSLPIGRPWRQPYPQRRRERFCPGHFYIDAPAQFWVCLSVCLVSILVHRPGIVSLSRDPEPSKPAAVFQGYLP